MIEYRKTNGGDTVNKIKTALALLLILALLGCVSLPAAAEEDRGTIPFPEMEYSRPDVDAMQQNLDAVRRVLEKGLGYPRTEKLLDEFFTRYYSFRTMYVLAQICSYLNLGDTYYAEEYAWCMENYPTVDSMLEELFYLCGESALAEELEEKYFWEGFAQEYANSEDALYDAELVDLLQQESALLSEYYALIASPTIHINGAEQDYYSYMEHASGSAYEQGMMAYYREYNESFSQLYIELVKVRGAIAWKLGYDDYEQMQFDYYWERDYTPEQADAYIQDVRTYIVPVYKMAESRGYVGRYGNNALSERELYRSLRTGATKMGGIVEEAFQFMSDYVLYDIHRSETKANTSFQTYLDDYEAPFLFLSPEGTVSDRMTIAHEFGHFVDAYYNYNADETIDVSETFSQAMEYLMLFYMQDGLTEHEQEDLYRFKLTDTLETYVQQASFAEFEHQVYQTDPEMLNADFLNELSLSTAKDFGYYDGYSRDYYALSWVDIAHFFEAPFYVVTYPVSNDLALQIFALEQQQPGAGLEKYLEILPRYNVGLIATALDGGLESPFAPGRVAQAAEDMRQLLEGERAAA